MKMTLSKLLAANRPATGKKILLALAGAGLLMGAVGVNATPEHDRDSLVKYFKNKYPDVKKDSYIYGALAFDPDAKSQYDSIMDFPPFGSVLDQGKAMWDTPFKNGKKYADCFPNGGKNVAGNYPYFDDKAGKVVTFEMAINACRVQNGEDAFKYNDMKTIGVLTAYARTLSDGMAMNIKVDGSAATAAYEAGKKQFYSRRGQLNFSCATCHGQEGKRIRLQDLPDLTTQKGAGAGFGAWPAYRVSSGELWGMQRRLNDCYRQQRFPYPGFASDATVALGVYMGVTGKGAESIAPALKR